MKAPADDVRTVPVFVVVPPRLLLLDVAGPAEVLRRANLEQARVRFTVAYVGSVPAVVSSIGLALADISPFPTELPSDAVVLLPGVADVSLAPGDGRAEQADPRIDSDADINADAAANADDAIVRWLSTAIRPGMRLASICSGALLAGRAGLLDGYECTTHHGSTAELAKLAPRARVIENRLYVDSGERLTSAGVTAGIDLMLHIVAQEAGSATALAVARHMVIYMRRAGSDPQLSPWLEGRNHIHPAVHRAQDAVAENPSASWSLRGLARIAGTSSRNLSRLFSEHTGMTVTDYVNRLRIATAHELVTTSRLDMEDVAERSGFASTRQFRRAWSRLHPVPPSRLRSDLRPT